MRHEIYHMKSCRCNQWDALQGIPIRGRAWRRSRWRGAACNDEKSLLECNLQSSWAFNSVQVNTITAQSYVHWLNCDLSEAFDRANLTDVFFKAAADMAH